MSELKNIVDKIQKRDLDKALELCELNKNSKNKHNNLEEVLNKLILLPQPYFQEHCHHFL